MVSENGVKINLDGEEVVLLATVQAAMSISKIYKGIAPVTRALTEYDLDAFALVIRSGANLKDSHEVVMQKAFDTGLVPLVAPLSEYIGLLLNGGRSFADDEDTKKKPQGKKSA